MEVIDLIIRIGALATAIAAIIAIVQKAVKPIAKMHEDITGIAARTKKIEEHDREQYLGILRLTIMSEEMPITERLIAGKKYIAAGGNGDVKHYYLELVQKHTK